MNEQLELARFIIPQLCTTSNLVVLTPEMAAAIDRFNQLLKEEVHPG